MSKISNKQLGQIVKAFEPLKTLGTKGTHRTDRQKRTIVRDIFTNYPDILAGTLSHGISVGSYYTWKNKFFKNGKGLKRGNVVSPKTGQFKTGANKKAIDNVTFNDTQDIEIATTVKTTTDFMSMVEENNFLWRKVSRLMNGAVR